MEFMSEAEVLPRRRKIMIVDDEEHAREALKLRLESRDDQVVCCAGGEEALAQLQMGSLPDLILLDLLMPDMDGWQFRIEQKKRPAWASIPVIVVSGDHSAQAEAVDAAAYLCKPLDEQELMQTVDRVAREADRNRALAQASELERLISLGSLIGGIAHEINNPLALLFGSIDVLQRQLVGLAQPAQASEPFSVAGALRALENARRSAERIAGVVQCASLFASADLESVESIDVHRVLESSIQVASNEIRHGAHLVRNYESLPHVRCNPARLGQIFLNVLLNAVYAIRDNGGRDHVIRVSTSLEESYVVVTITDSATELDAQTVARIFDPLSAATAGGARLHFGLAVSREVVQSMGGLIEVRTVEPQGVSFRILLPSDNSRSTYPPPAPKPPTRLASQRLPVMVIDDEPQLCELFSAMLSDQYDVAAFSSPRSALASMLQGNFAVIVCDVMMPELNGMEVYAQAIRERPELQERFVFVTGGAFTERARLFLRQTGRPTLRKPCSRSALLKVVGEVAATAAAQLQH
jgi:CheY-like chemotaxis protein